ncbi:TerD family protein [Streptomyces sp. NPDC102490]|uniref:TerD family protein n=1 Tax=Streptomyces sp. NPDC102490 TaxID=3366183 RepID=UPI0037F1A82A
MQTTSLRKGENTVLSTARTVLSESVQGLSADVSALLLGADGKVRGDHDLVSYNHPAQAGVSVAGAAVTVDLPRLPADVQQVTVVVSADPLQPGAVFTRAPQLSVTQSGVTLASFTAPDFTAGETVVVLAEAYRRQEGWKLRAVGQGYATGLAGLATDYGVDVDTDPEPSGARLPPQTRTAGAPVASADLTKLERKAPGLLAPASDSSTPRSTGAGATWPTRCAGRQPLPGIRSRRPAFVVTQVGDEPWDKAEVRSMLQSTASLGIFRLFVGFGRGKLAFSKEPQRLRLGHLHQRRLLRRQQEPRLSSRRTLLHRPCRLLRDLDAIVSRGSYSEGAR